MWKQHYSSESNIINKVIKEDKVINKIKKVIKVATTK
jgi:hypothetical protein